VFKIMKVELDLDQDYKEVIGYIAKEYGLSFDDLCGDIIKNWLLLFKEAIYDKSLMRDIMQELDINE